MSAGRQSCVIVSQRSGRADPNPPEGQPVARETIILPEYYMVRRGEPTTAEEYQTGTLQFKALHPGEGVPPRNTGYILNDPKLAGSAIDSPLRNFIDAVEESTQERPVSAPPVFAAPYGKPQKPRIVRKVKQPEPTPDQPIYNSILNLVACLDDEHNFKLLKHLAELNGMEME